MLALY